MSYKILRFSFIIVIGLKILSIGSFFIVKVWLIILSFFKALGYTEKLGFLKVLGPFKKIFFYLLLSIGIWIELIILLFCKNFLLTVYAILIKA